MAERESARKFWETLDREAIAAAIREAEARSLGEIRVHVHRGRVSDPRAEAERTFFRLGMEKTRGRTGCLIFVAPEERAFAVIGDAGVHEKVGDSFWQNARDAAALHFSAGRFTEGLVEAVRRLGDVLAQHFPASPGEGNPNELPDAVSEGGGEGKSGT